MSDIPHNYTLRFSQEQIHSRVIELAKEIREGFELVNFQPKEQIVAVCVLRGAIFFFADLIRQLDLPIEPMFCRAESYNSENQQTGKGVRVSVDEVKAEGKHVLIVDDICDTGLTLLKLHNVFLGLGAKSVRSAVLIHREVQQSKYEPTFSAFSYSGKEWFVGYGLDNGGEHRALPEVYTLKPQS